VIRCPYCDDMSPALAAQLHAQQLEVCPGCGREFRQLQPERSSGWEREDAFDANPVEAKYAETPVTRTNQVLEHDAHDVLRYASALLDLTSVILDFIVQSPESVAVLGFLTGSDDLDWLPRRLLGHRLPDRFRNSRGFSHNAGGASPEAELHAHLGRWIQAGVDRIVVVDEVDSGGQMRAALKRIRSWYRSQKALPPLTLHLVGFAEERSIGSEDPQALMKRKVLQPPLALPAGLSVTAQLLAVPTLLAKDKAGQPLKSTILRKDGNYEPKRTCPAEYAIRCPNSSTVSLADSANLRVGRSAGSLDQTFGVTILAICGFAFVRPELWPQTILNGGCAECRALLLVAREKAQAVAARTDILGDMCGAVIDCPERRARALLDAEGKSVRSPDSDVCSS
jgi:hypothetical protein